MKHSVAAGWYYQTDSRFENYSYRYASDWHCDLMDVLSDFGASTPVKLDEVARACGFPGKLGIDGSKVAGMVAEGRLAEVRDYCETDVLNTFLVYLRYRLLTGDLTKASYDEALAQVVSYIETQDMSRPHLRQFQRAWASAKDTT